MVTPNMSILKHINRPSSPNSQNDNLFHSSLLKKISLLNCEKVHLHFLKWALGVNRKSVNCGVWGESGRYPLIYESINLTLKYFERLAKLKDNSLVKLAFLEQRERNLDWYRGIEPILQLDPHYSLDHITAHTHRTDRTFENANHEHPTNPTKENFLFHNGFKKRVPSQVITPRASKQFTTHIIMKALKLRFKESWVSDNKTFHRS